MDSEQRQEYAVVERINAIKLETDQDIKKSAKGMAINFPLAAALMLAGATTHGAVLIAGLVALVAGLIFWFSFSKFKKNRPGVALKIEIENGEVMLTVPGFLVLKNGKYALETRDIKKDIILPDEWLKIITLIPSTDPDIPSHLSFGMTWNIEDFPNGMADFEELFGITWPTE